MAFCEKRLVSEAKYKARLVRTYLTGGELSEVKVLHRTSRGERLLRVVENVGHRVHPNLVVRKVDSHRLLAHGRLVRVARRLRGPRASANGKPIEKARKRRTWL